MFWLQTRTCDFKMERSIDKNCALFSANTIVATTLLTSSQVGRCRSGANVARRERRRRRRHVERVHRRRQAQRRKVLQHAAVNCSVMHPSCHSSRETAPHLCRVPGPSRKMTKISRCFAQVYMLQLGRNQRESLIHCEQLRVKRDSLTNFEIDFVNHKRAPSTQPPLIFVF